MCRMYSELVKVLPAAVSLHPDILSRALEGEKGESLKPFLRLALPPRVSWAQTTVSFSKFMRFLLGFQIKQKKGGKGYNLNVQQALCIAQTDPEPEAREQALLALDSSDIYPKP